MAGHEEEIAAVHYYIINLNHWRFDRVINSRKSEILYSENSFPLLIILNSWGSKFLIYLKFPYFSAICIPFFIDLVFFLFWIDDQKIFRFFQEKVTNSNKNNNMVEQEKNKVLNIDLNLAEIKPQIVMTSNFKRALFIGFLTIAVIFRNYYREDSYFNKWHVNYLGFFMVFPIFFNSYKSLRDFKEIFIYNALFFFVDIERFYQTVAVFLFNFFIFLKFRKKIICFLFGYLLLNLDILISYFIEKELPNELRSKIFLWKLFIFLQIFFFFFLIIRPKPRIQKYASFISEM